MSQAEPDCPLCATHGGQLLVDAKDWRIVLVDEPAYPGFTRVIWKSHVAEMTDLSPQDRGQLMSTVFMVEQLMREHLKPDKVNLASLGNQVPHLHWHVIPRFADDMHYPDPIWATAQRDATQTDTSAVLNYCVAIKAWAQHR